MAQNNLRIIYNNVADSATSIVASSTAGTTTTANLKKDTKALVWRSVGTTATLTVTLPTAQIVGGVILPFCNLSSTATVRVQLNTGLDTGNVLAAPYQTLGAFDWGFVPLGVNYYTQGGYTYGRVWFAATSATIITITITDTANTSGYIELSRLVVGSYWSPKYNTGYGMSVVSNDTSNSNRTESGDLVGNLGVRFSSMKFDLNWLTPSDRLQLTTLLRKTGTNKPLFISLFPNNSEEWSKEQMYQVYGKLPQTSDVSHPMFGIYSSQIEIEEV